MFKLLSIFFFLWEEFIVQRILKLSLSARIAKAISGLSLCTCFHVKEVLYSKHLVHSRIYYD